MKAITSTAIFNPSVGSGLGGRNVLQPTGFSKKVPFYSAPSNMSDPDRLKYCAYLMLCGTSVETGIEKWKTWVLTYVVAVTPSFADVLPGGSHLKQPISPVAVQTIVGLMTDLETALDRADAAAVGIANNAISRSTALELLPKPNPRVDYGKSWGEWTHKVVMCHYSIMLFLAGKRVSGTDHTQVTVARPRALKGKVHLDDAIDLLEGDCRMSDIAHVSINNAWSELGSARGIVFTEYAKYGSVEADEMQNIIWTTMHLLRFSNMAHAAIVFNFIQTYPWVYDVSVLRPALSSYARSVVEANNMDRALLPYVKLIYGDKASIFPRKELEPLIACAVHALSQTQPTLAAFYHDPTYAGVIDVFDKMRNLKEAKLNAELGLLAHHAPEEIALVEAEEEAT